jgi:hypothetical protein
MTKLLRKLTFRYLGNTGTPKNDGFLPVLSLKTPADAEHFPSWEFRGMHTFFSCLQFVPHNRLIY